MREDSGDFMAEERVEQEAQVAVGAAAAAARRRRRSPPHLGTNRCRLSGRAGYEERIEQRAHRERK